MYVCDTPSAGARNHLSALLSDGRRLLEILGCYRRKIYGSASYSWIIALEPHEVYHEQQS